MGGPQYFLGLRGVKYLNKGLHISTVRAYLYKKMYCVFTPTGLKLFKFAHKCKGKGKAIPLQAWTGPEGSRRLRLPDFMTIGT
jgi:hypothetical protein